MASSKQEITPNAQKKKLALIFAGGITFLIFLAWILIFIGDAKRELEQTSESRVALFSVFEENIGKFADKFVSEFKNLPVAFVATSSEDLETTSSASSTSATIEDLSSTTEIDLTN